MSAMAGSVGIAKILAKVQGQVKYTSLESGTMPWKTGNLEVATMETGQVVCLVNFKIGPPKTFMLTNQINGVTFTMNGPRCTIKLDTGTNINWLGKCHDKGMSNSSAEVQLIKNILESLSNSKRKKDGRPNSSAQLSLHMSPNPLARTPVKQVSKDGSHQIGQRRGSTPKPLVTATPVKCATPKGLASFSQSSSGRTSGRTSPNLMTTPTLLRAGSSRPASASPPRLSGEIYDIAEDSGTGSDEGTAYASPLLFTDVRLSEEEGKSDKKSYRIPKVKPSNRSKSVYEMRKEEGGSLFMSSFQEKQLQLEERKENMAPKPNIARNFYSRGRQAAGYAAADALVQTSYKRTPGFLTLSQPKKPRLSTGYVGWSHKNVAPSTKTSQISLQGFSNLGNTCYMNAILQSLFALDHFTMDILNSDLAHMQRDSLYKALAALLFDKLRNQSAEKIGAHLRRVKLAISATATRFSGCLQHDAQEFLCQCLDQLKEDWEKAQQRALDNSPSVTSPARDKKPDPKPASRRCPVVGNFEFDVLHTIICKQCQGVVTKTEQFYNLSLDMPRRSTSNPIGSIQTALQQFFQAEAIEYACSECECKQAIVTHTFTKLPRVIIIHLKRYRFDVDAALNSKLQRRILIPKFLTLHYHCSKEMLSPGTAAATAEVSSPASLTKRIASPLRLLNRDSTIHRTDSSGKESAKRFNFNSSSRKKLDYLDSTTRNKGRQTILLDDPPSSKEDETQHVLQMSKREAERAKLEAKERLKREEEELQEAMEQSKHETDRSLAVMSEDQQLAYAIAISKQETSKLHSKEALGLADLTSAEVDADVEGVGEGPNDAGIGSVIKDCREEVSTEVTFKRGTDDMTSPADQTRVRNSTPWKRLRTDDYESNQGSPSEHAQCAADSGIDLVDDSHDLDKRTPSRSWQSVGKSIAKFFTPVKRTPGDGQTDTPRLTPLVESTPVDVHREQDRATLQVGESSEEKPSYEELRAKEDEELRRATELSLQDAQEMAMKEEDALKRAKEISLQEFSEGFNGLPFEEEEETMEIEDDTDEEVRTELTKNTETGYLPSSYRLTSVVSHIGSSSSVGHYISDVYDSKKTAWLSYDDSQVVKTSESSVREDRERTGYIFFYVAR